jgi:hypothetical protein
MDFTVNKYIKLLKEVRKEGYNFQTVEAFIMKPGKRVMILRHDVDERPGNALEMARAEAGLGIRATYYFRIVKISNDPEIIKQIVNLGHEIGYHYEDYSANAGNIELALKQFSANLAYFRTFYPVKTVCMHGSSMSSFDNRKLWEHASLDDFGIIAEPYLTIDYSDIFYLTDTGRRWDGGKYSVRDSVSNHFKLSFRSTNDIIRAIQNNILPDKVLLQSHTLWTNEIAQWLWLEFREKTRNRIKIAFVKIPFLRNLAYKIISKHSNK